MVSSNFPSNFFISTEMKIASLFPVFLKQTYTFFGFLAFSIVMKVSFFVLYHYNIYLPSPLRTCK